MRSMQFSLLALGTLFLLGGCGKVEQSAQVAPSKAPADRATPAKAPAARSAETSRTLARAGESTADAEPSAKEEGAKSGPAPPREPEGTKPVVEALEEKPYFERFRQRIRPGTLTAGNLNDHQNFDDYRAYLSEAQQSAGGRNLPSFNIGQRIAIEVKDAQGNGVSDVHITVTALEQTQGENEGVLLDTSTRADGKAFFATGLDARSQGETFELTVRPPGGEAIVKQVSSAQSPWVVELPQVTQKLPGQLDLALVIDTTSSMADELNYLKVELDSIVARVHGMFPGVQQRYALIVYRDEGDEYVVRNVIDFTDSLVDFRVRLAAQLANGGGDVPEAMHVALENSTRLSWRHENTARVMFLVADAPPHAPHVDRTLSAVKDLRQKGVAIYPVAASGVMAECEFLMRAAAFLTRGQYLFLTDHSGVGNPHAKPHAPKYEVEPLNQLMVRMIASELSGRPVLAQEIIATEQSDGREPAPIPQEQNQSSTAHPEQHHRPIQPLPGFVSGRREYEAVWNTAWFRILAAVLIISGILYVDSRLRA